MNAAQRFGLEYDISYCMHKKHIQIAYIIGGVTIDVSPGKKRHRAVVAQRSTPENFQSFQIGANVIVRKLNTFGVTYFYNVRKRKKRRREKKI